MKRGNVCQGCGHTGHLYERRRRCWACYIRLLAWVTRPCRHCGRKGFLWLRRGLCKACYCRPGMRGKYAPLVAERDPLASGLDFLGPACPAMGELQHPPGSQERIEELAERVRKREELFARHEAGMPPAVLAQLIGASGLG